MSVREQVRPSASFKREGAHVVEMQRRRLLLAAKELAAERGVENVIVGNVCKRAGVSRRTFYELFADREDCFTASFDHCVETVAERVAPTLHGPGSWRESMRAALSALLDCFDEDPALARLCVVESLRGGAKVQAHRERIYQALVVAVDRGRSEAKAGSEPPELTAQGVVGGVLSVIQARLHEHEHESLSELSGPLMAMIVHPYLGSAAARREVVRPSPRRTSGASQASADPFKGIPMRFTYRTARVLSAIATKPGASNRTIADSSGILDEGQMSRLLRRLEKYELVENRSVGHPKGEANAWTLTERGQAIYAAIAV
jgi:AcrR family transcriptional regulator/DNA-binding MarR family transcriptional regulator